MQISKINNQPLTLHRCLLDQGHGSSPMSGHQFQEDVNTSVSWDLIDTDTDTEVTNINSQSPHQTVTNKNCADSSNESQNHTVGLNHQLNTLYNQDFL